MWYEGHPLTRTRYIFTLSSISNLFIMYKNIRNMYCRCGFEDVMRSLYVVHMETQHIHA